MIRGEQLTAVLIGSPDKPLSVRGGSISLDTGAAPHVAGQLVIALPDAATLAGLDPRANARVRLTCTPVSEDGTPGTSRVFNLGVRERPREIDGGTVSLTLAGDEALLMDYAPLADDTAPRDRAASLRAVVNYVLGKAVPGAQLATSPANDADVTPYWELTNLVINPSVVNGTTGYLAGANAPEVGTTTVEPHVGTTCLYWRAGAAGESSIRTYSIGVTGGIDYRFSVYVRNDHAGGRSMRLQLRFVSNDQDLTPIKTVSGAWQSVPAGQYTRLTLAATAPPDARVMAFVIGQATAANDTFRADAFMVHEDVGTVENYFQGSGIPAPPGYETAWTDVQNRSQSVRTPLVSRDPDALVWRAGQSALDFLVPLVQSSGLRLVCDEQRAWTLRADSYRAAGALQLREGANVTDGTIQISRDDESWFDAAVVRYTWTGRDGLQHSEVDAYALTTPYTRPRLFERDTPYPGPGFAQYAVQRAQGRGREVTASAQTDWAVRAEMVASIVPTGEPSQLGTVQRVEFDLDQGEMTVAVRSVDAAAGSWLGATVDYPTQTWAQAAVQRPTETWKQAAERTA
jgi:hypothetical protein